MEREKKRIRVVVDSNVAFSFIIKGRSSAYMDIFSKDNLEMYAPEDILYEFRKYSGELKSKSEEFEETVFLVFSFIRIIPKKVYLDTIEKAQNICTKFDEKISPFIGLALKLKIPIWTNDKDNNKNRDNMVFMFIKIEELSLSL